MSKLKNQINSRKVLKEDYDYLKSLHNAVCGAIVKHNNANVHPNEELLKKQASVERIMQRMKNIIDFGVHDKDIVPLLKSGIHEQSLF